MIKRDRSGHDMQGKMRVHDQIWGLRWDSEHSHDIGYTKMSSVRKEKKGKSR